MTYRWQEHVGPGSIITWASAPRTKPALDGDDQMSHAGRLVEPDIAHGSKRKSRRKSRLPSPSRKPALPGRGRIVYRRLQGAHHAHYTYKSAPGSGPTCEARRADTRPMSRRSARPPIKKWRAIRRVLFGLDVDDPKAIQGTTRGLFEKYGPERVFGTPLSEDAMTGAAIGMALAGLRPIHVHIRMDFLMLAMNQLVNVAAKSRYMYGGRVSFRSSCARLSVKAGDKGRSIRRGYTAFSCTFLA